MAITLVQSNVGATAAGVVLNVSYTTNVTAGNGLAAFAFCDSSALTISDLSLGGPQTWVQDVHFVSSGGRHIYAWHVSNNTGTTGFAVQITPTTGIPELHLHIFEHSGTDTSSPLDGSTSGTEGVATNYDPGSFSITDADIVYGFQANAGTTNPNPETGYTRQTNVTANFNSAVEYQIFGGSATVDPDWPSNPNAGFFALGVSYKPAAAGDTLMGQAVL